MKKAAVTAPAEALLAHHPVFSVLPASVREELVAGASIVRIPKYSLIYRQGDEVTAVYLVMEGLVKKYRDLGQSDRTAGFMYKGDVIGLDAMFTAGGHLFCAQALGFVTACAFAKENVVAAGKAHPDFCSAILRHMSVQLEASLHEQDVMSARTTNGRIADRILRLTEKFGKVEPGGTTLMLRITQRELASMAGTNRESVCKAILMFKKEGSLDIANKLIVVKDREKLEAWP